MTVLFTPPNLSAKANRLTFGTLTYSPELGGDVPLSWFGVSRRGRSNDRRHKRKSRRPDVFPAS
jgi:hypothetical protein